MSKGSPLNISDTKADKSSLSPTESSIAYAETGNHTQVRPNIGNKLSPLTKGFLRSTRWIRIILINFAWEHLEGNA